MTTPVRYVRPGQLEQALALLASGQRQVLAGGTDVYAALGDHCKLGDVIDITSIEILNNIENVDGRWKIGAGVTWSDVVAAKLPPLFDCLKSAAREVGGIQIQNAGTIVGNLCNASPAADGVPPLLAMGASLEISSVEGTRFADLGDFITGPRVTALAKNELVTAVLIPNRSSRCVSSFLKLGSRKYLAISIAMVAVVLEPTHDLLCKNIGISVGSCSAVPRRLRDLELKLTRQPLNKLGDEALVPEFFSALAPIDDIRASSKYRLIAAAELVRRAIIACVNNT